MIYMYIENTGAYYFYHLTLIHNMLAPKNLKVPSSVI